MVVAGFGASLKRSSSSSCSPNIDDLGFVNGCEVRFELNS